MNTEKINTDVKSRKGSCSTISSPNQAFLCFQQHSTKIIRKHKKVKKLKKLRRTSSLMSQQSEEKDHKNQIDIVKQNQIRIFRMVKNICQLFNFNIDTYLVSLKIVNILKFDGEAFLCMHVAASIGFMVQKLYESYKVSFNNISNWTGFQLTKETYADTEAAILSGLDFQLPIIDSGWTEQEIRREIHRIQAMYACQFQI